MLCSDDPYGCWLPAFAVVHEKWTEREFPETVEYDVAYYVIPNQSAAHEPGFKTTRSDVLEEVGEAFPVDFDWRHGEGTFLHSLGYSLDKDPAFRYCADDMSTLVGAADYENLWLSACGLTSGASGGPWLRDLDEHGTGSIVSVNSWGFVDTPGMGGVNFATSEGGTAECLFDVAERTSFASMQSHGIIAREC